jgi:hypothetical protein
MGVEKNCVDVERFEMKCLYSKSCAEMSSLEMSRFEEK